MSDLSKSIDIFLNLDDRSGKPLRSSINSSSRPQALILYAGNRVPVRIFPRLDTGIQNSPTRTTRLDTESLVFAAKSFKRNSKLYFLCANFSEANTQTDNTGDWYYHAILDLSGSEIMAVVNSLSPNESKFDVVCDIELRNVVNSQRLTYQFGASIYRQVIRGDETFPEPPMPPAATFRIQGGEIQMINKATGDFHAFWADQQKDTDGNLIGFPFLVIDPKPALS